MAPINRQQQQLSPSTRGPERTDSDEVLARRFKDGLVQAPYYSTGRIWEDYVPAYRFGQRSQRRHAGLRFEDVEAQLEREWDGARDQSRLGWVEARGAVEDAWSRHELQQTRAVDDGRHGTTGYEHS